MIVYKGGRHLPAVLRAVDDAGRDAVYGEELGRAGRDADAAGRRRAVLLHRDRPAARDGRGSRL